MERLRCLFVYLLAAVLLTGACADDTGSSEETDVPSTDAGDADLDTGEPDADASTDTGTLDSGEVDSGPVDDATDTADGGIQEIPGDTETREPCATICADAGLECDGTYEHYILGEGGNLVDYEGALSMESCDHVPAATEMVPGQGESQLTRYTCFCR